VKTSMTIYRRKGELNQWYGGKKKEGKRRGLCQRKKGGEKWEKGESDPRSARLFLEGAAGTARGKKKKKKGTTRRGGGGEVRETGYRAKIAFTFK